MHVTSTSWLRQTIVVCVAGLLALTMVACQGQAGRLASSGEAALSGSASDALGTVLFDGRATSIAEAGRPAWSNRSSARITNAPLVSPPPPPLRGTYTVRSASAPVTTQPAGLVTTWSGPRTYDIPPPPPPPAAPTPYQPGFDSWSTPAAPSGAVAPAPRLIGSTAPAAPTYTQSQPVSPSGPPTVTYVDQPAAPPAPVLTSPLQSGQWNGCGLPCANGISTWHVRGVVGRAFFSGTDAPEDCGYAGVDVGRTFCGCWGLDAFYRWNSGQFHRLTNGQAGLDGAEFSEGMHHVGMKLTYESSFGNSKFFWWGGAGPEYFWSEGYDVNDTGFGIYAELGIGYVVNRSFRIRAGINVHGLDTDITRRDPADDGQSRWLWVLAPVVQLEIDF